MLRLACCLATECGVEVCAPVHDALLITAPVEEIEAAVAVTREAMAEASRAVLDGFEVRTDAKIRARGWDYTMHPSFGDFASSMLASDYVQHLDFLKNDEELRKRYLPRALYTIGPSGVWEPAKGERQSKHFAHRK